MNDFQDAHIILIESAIGSMFASLILQSFTNNLAIKWAIWAFFVILFFKYLRPKTIPIENQPA